MAVDGIEIHAVRDLSTPAADDYTFKDRDRSRPTMTRRPATGGCRPLALAAGPGGAWLAAAGTRGEVLLLDPRAVRAPRTLNGHRALADQLAVTDGGLLLSAGADRTLLVHALGEDDPPGRRSPGTASAGPGTAAAVPLPDAQVLALVVLPGHGVLLGGARGTHRLVRAPTADPADPADWCAAAAPWLPPVPGTPADPDGLDAAVRHLAADAAGTLLAAAVHGGLVVVDRCDGDTPRHLALSRITALAVSPDGSRAAVAAGGRLLILDPADPGAPVADVTVGRVVVLTWSPDGSRLLVAGAADGTVALLDRDGRPRGALPGHGATVTCLAVAPDGSWAATGDVAGRVLVHPGSGPERLG